MRDWIEQNFIRNLLKSLFLNVIQTFFFLLIAVIIWQIILLVESSRLGDFGDPIATLYFWSGWICMVFLIFSFVSPKLKKQIGLFAFMMGILHTGIFVILDFGWNFDFIFAELSQKYYLYFGILSLLCMLISALGSFGAFHKLKLYYLVYLALFFALVHLLLIQKILTLNYILIGVAVIGLISYKIFKRIKKKHNV